jgi:SAM-dependent methyltransferase
MLDEHLGYVADRKRLEQFKAAIARTLKPGDRVADLGCGSGVLGLLCLQAGASHVVAIDSSAMIEVARQAMTRAGLEDRCTFIHARSHRATLAEPVDVVICDHVGYFGFDYGIVRTMQDARARFLVPGGRVIPARIRLKIAAVESDAARAKVDRWRAEGVPDEFHWLQRHAANLEHAVTLPRAALLGPPSDLGEIDLRADQPDFFRWTAKLRVERDGVLHGLAGWFECDLADGVAMTNSPLSDDRIDRPQAFLPIEEPVAVRAGDTIAATVMARPDDHLIAWVVEIASTGRRFSHSTWPAMPSLPSDLIRSRPEHVPRLSREGRAAVVVLGYCDSRRTVREIEEAVLRDHPDLFPTRDEIARFVAHVLGRDTA